MEDSISNVENQIVNPADIELPEELRNKVATIQCESEKGISNIYLIGTCHVSSQSSKDVAALISFLKPDVVFLELCQNRACILDFPEEFPEFPRLSELIVGIWKGRNDINGFEFFSSWLFYMFGKAVGVVPGSEFRNANREAKKYGCKVILGERPIDITCQRTWSRMSFRRKTEFVLSCLLGLVRTSKVARGLESLNSDSTIENIAKQLETEYPSMAETFTYERDLFMASKLFEIVQGNKSVVAVVGRAHVAGIQKNWKKPVALESLMKFHEPAKSSSSVKIWIKAALGAAGIGLFCLKWLKR